MATKNLNISITGGSASIGQVIQAEQVTTEGDVMVRTDAAALDAFRQAVAREISARALPSAERQALEARVAALEQALKDAAGGQKSALARLRAVVEDIRGAFGWTAPLLKQLCALCAPALAALL